ncbi:MAG TPA: hypothetical protein VGG28_07185 [Kofleriaceae bacterium]
MNRIAFSFVIAAALAPTTRVWADDAPTKEQIDAAKKAFGEGKQLHDAGKLPEAIDKFKESYRLSKNPVLLYNIALTLDENKQSDSALFYYRKFLSDAPADAAQRKPAEDRVKVLENDKLNSEMSGKGGEDTTDTKPSAGKKHSSTKYTAADFKHNVVEEAPPNKPLDIAATIPDGADLSVVLYYRAAGQADFVAKPMKWHDTEVVARIPASKVNGSALQYYIEVKDSSGNKLTSSGKPSSPNLINIDPAAAEHSYSDFVDDMPVREPKKGKDEDNPLGGSTGDDTGPKDGGETPAGPTGTGMFDPGSHKFEVTKWSVTGGAVLFVGLTVVFDVMASSQANALVQDAQRTSCTPHCTFDSYDAQIQSAGERDETLSRVSLGLGIAGAVVAGYFWYRDLTHHTSSGETAAPAEPAVVIVPTLGNDTYGAAAAVRF